MKQYALEYGSLGIRCNAVNADRIRTHLLDEADVAARARSRGLEPDAYYRANLLGREVTADDVADAFVYLATAPSTTGSVVTVDGGNIARAALTLRARAVCVNARAVPRDFYLYLVGRFASGTALTMLRTVVGCTSTAFPTRRFT